MEVSILNLKPKVVIDRDVEESLQEGLEDLKEGRLFGPFSSVKEFKQTLLRRRREEG